MILPRFSWRPRGAEPVSSEWMFWEREEVYE